MAIIKSVNGLTPKWGKECYFSENAAIVGEVTMGDECSVWFNAVVRGDVAPVTMGNRVNVQDGAVVHVTNKIGPTFIEDDVQLVPLFWEALSSVNMKFGEAYQPSSSKRPSPIRLSHTPHIMWLIPNGIWLKTNNSTIKGLLKQPLDVFQNNVCCPYARTHIRTSPMTCILQEATIRQ